MAEEDGKYKICKLLGEGGFGKVFLIEEIADPSVKQALKIMDLTKMDDGEMKLALQEIQLLSSLDHQHVLSYVTCFRQDTNLCIVTEYCPNGDLSDYIENQHGNKLEEDRLIEWFRQIASAVEYLHSKNIIHRDLKVQNVFLDANMDCKLGDLGIARILNSTTDFAQTQIGTLHYMSPEIFMGIPYNFKTDIWSLAIVIYELATLEKPFDALFLPGLIYKVTRGQTPDMPTGYRPEFGTLLSKMMEKDPDDRPSASDIINDVLFKRPKKPKPMPSLFFTKLGDPANSDDDEILDFAIVFLHTLSQMFADGAAARPPLPFPDRSPPGGAAAGKKADDDDDKQDPVMELVTRTLKDMGHNTLRPAGTGRIEHQVRMLKMYILNVLNNDEELFNKADKELDKTDDDENLEEKLIRILGHENFGMCGVELLHYKNFTYNLKHRKK
ncbi:Serine/threonine-protein kinase Nek4 [Mactra antiquata]